MNSTSIGTVSGKILDFRRPHPDDICIHDIATGLAQVARFSGQLDFHYSVAQHSICVARTVWRETCDPVIALQALLHDASEAYMGDCPSPLKALLQPGWGVFEGKLMDVIYTKYGVPTEMHYNVKEADARWCVTEKELLQIAGPSWNGTKMGTVEPYKFDAPLHPIPTNRIERLFTEKFDEYYCQIPA